MKIRVAGAADASAIAEIHAESWRVAYRGMLRDDYLDRAIFSERLALWEHRFSAPPANQHVMVAEIDRAVAGFACVYGGEDSQWGSFLDNLHVVPEHKRHGIGTVLMTRVAGWNAANFPGTGLYLWVLDSNEPAIRFYERLGGSHNGEGVWRPPDGGEYRKLRYVWPSSAPLLARSPG